MTLSIPNNIFMCRNFLSPMVIGVLLFALCSSTLCAQEAPLLKPARVIFYNCENLFDTINDPETQDEDFLPSSKYEWNTKKYAVKLNHIAKVISALCDTIQPLAIGLCEVENKKVLEDLLAQHALKKFNLGIIHHNSPDERGIDCALLYNKDVLEEVFDQHLTVDLGEDKTRDILYFKCFVNENFPLWFFVNHWPSRRGGQDESEGKRGAAAKVLREKIENIYLGEPYSRIITMGDFNDNPTDKSLLSLSSGKNKIADQQDLVNLMKPLYEHGEFTLTYKEEKDIFDQFIVSKNLVSKKFDYNIRNSEAHIFSPEFLLHTSKEGNVSPNRTYVGTKWVGGYSDHLPVYIDLVFK